MIFQLQATVWHGNQCSQKCHLVRAKYCSVELEYHAKRMIKAPAGSKRAIATNMAPVLGMTSSMTTMLVPHRKNGSTSNAAFATFDHAIAIPTQLCRPCTCTCTCTSRSISSASLRHPHSSHSRSHYSTNLKVFLQMTLLRRACVPDEFSRMIVAVDLHHEVIRSLHTTTYCRLREILRLSITWISHRCHPGIASGSRVSCSRVQIQEFGELGKSGCLFDVLRRGKEKR